MVTRTQYVDAIHRTNHAERVQEQTLLDIETALVNMVPDSHQFAKDVAMKIIATALTNYARINLSDDYSIIERFERPARRA